jgi:polysaccharide export outer membrane protein
VISRLTVVGACLVLTGCAAIPGAGPSTWAMRDSAGEVEPASAPAAEAYAFVPMTPSLAASLNLAAPTRASAPFPADAPPPRVGIGPGDEIEVTIVSVNPSGFVDFSQSTVNPVATTTLPAQRIDASGMINVPPVGRVRASGLTPQALEARLTERLAQVLVDPSVLVRVVSRVSDQASVIGLVEDPGRHPVEGADMRVLDLVAAAGGPGTDGGGAGISTRDELVLTLTRGGRSASAGFAALFEDPSLNVRVWPGDVITLEAATRRFTVFGASGTPE